MYTSQPIKSNVVSQNPINSTRNKNPAAQQQREKSRYCSDCNTNTPAIQFLLALSSVLSNGDRQVKYDKPMAWSLSPRVPSDDKCSSELLLRRLHDNGQSTGFQALSQYHTSLQWFRTQFVSIFYSIGQDSRSGCPSLLLIHGVKLFLLQTYITVGVAQRDSPFARWGKGVGVSSCAVGAVWCRASVCPLWACHSAEPSQLPGSGRVKQHLSSREVPLYEGEGCDRQHPPPCPRLFAWLHTSSTSLRTTGKTQENLWG